MSYRLVVHGLDAPGVWRVIGPPYQEQREAEDAGAHAMTQGCTNAGVYPVVEGVLQTPSWMTLQRAGGHGP